MFTGSPTHSSHPPPVSLTPRAAVFWFQPQETETVSKILSKRQPDWIYIDLEKQWYGIWRDLDKQYHSWQRYWRGWLLAGYCLPCQRVCRAKEKGQNAFKVFYPLTSGRGWPDAATLHQCWEVEMMGWRSGGPPSWLVQLLWGQNRKKPLSVFRLHRRH